MKTLSVQSQYAYQIVYGVKNVENRTWKTKHRGKMLIHASGANQVFPDPEFLPEYLCHRYMQLQNQPRSKYDIEALLKFDYLCEDAAGFLHVDAEAVVSMTDADYKKFLVKLSRKYGFPLRAQAIIGEVDLVDIVENSTSRFAMPGQYHWILENPVFFGPQIYGIKGKLRLWDFDLQTEPNRVII